MFYGRSRRHGWPVIARRLLLISLLVSVLVPMTANPALAFPATDTLTWRGVPLPAGKIAETHQSITTESVHGLVRQVFGISTLTPEMQNALDRIIAANAAVDDDQAHSLLHFDGETFPEGQARLIGLVDSIMKDLAAQNVIAAQDDLGSALHTLQDFYSHSNWVELGNTAPNQDLGRVGHPLARLAANIATCDGSTLITNQLTSGYGGEKDRVATAHKCHHGGLIDAPNLAGINKDTRLALLSPHHEYHAEAARLAVLATTQFLNDIRRQLPSADQFALLLGQSKALQSSVAGSLDDCDFTANATWVSGTDLLSSDIRVHDAGKISLCSMRVVVSLRDVDDRELGVAGYDSPKACGQWIPLCAHTVTAAVGLYPAIPEGIRPAVDHLSVAVGKLDN